MAGSRVSDVVAMRTAWDRGRRGFRCCSLGSGEDQGLDGGLLVTCTFGVYQRDGSAYGVHGGLIGELLTTGVKQQGGDVVRSSVLMLMLRAS